MRIVASNFTLGGALAGCVSSQRSGSTHSMFSSALPEPAAPDEFSYAQPDRVVIRHLSLDLALNFEQRTLAGTATLDLDWKTSAGRELVLDTRDLEIGGVESTADSRS